MKNGALFKRCTCRDENRALLGAACPKLRRKGGAWSSDHGTWHIQLEVETSPRADRVHLRRAGYDTREAAETALREIRTLLDLAERAEFPDRARAQITALIRSALRKRTPLPDAHAVRTLIDLGQPADHALTLGEYLDQWIEGKAKTRAANTHRSYQGHIDQHLRPRLGHIPLARLTVAHANKAFTDIARDSAEAAERNTLRRAAHERAREAGRDRAARQAARLELAALGPFENAPGDASIQRIRATLRSALTDATKQGLIPLNVAKFIDLAPERKPKAKLWTAARETEWRRTGTRPSPVMVWTPQHTKIFLNRARDHRYHALYAAIAYLGLRRGEALAIRWHNIDFATGEITIEAQLVQLGWEVAETTPKTDAGARTLVAPEPLLVILAKHRRRQRRWAERAGDQWAPGQDNPSPYAFTDLEGHPIHPDDALEQFQRLTREADLPPIRLHDLRHGAATMARARGVDPKILSSMLGHSSTTITNDLYGDVATEAKREAANTIADQLAGEDDD